MITRPKALLRGTEPTPALLRGVIEEFERGHARLSRLKQYYLAENDILSRAPRPALPNTRLSHAFPYPLVLFLQERIATLAALVRNDAFPSVPRSPSRAAARTDH